LQAIPAEISHGYMARVLAGYHGPRNMRHKP
jgi:hypothetical protein